MPYLLENKTGSDLRFATAVDEVLLAKSMQRKPNAKWYPVPAGSVFTFEFRTKQLVAMVRNFFDVLGDIVFPHRWKVF